MGKPKKSQSTAPFSFHEWMIARRYLGTTNNSGGVSLITIIAFGGIMLAVAVLIVVMAVMQGFRAKLLDQLLGLNGHIFVESYEPITDYETLASRLIQIPEVINAAPVIQTPVYVASTNSETGAVVVGIRKNDLLTRDVMRDPNIILSGSFEAFETQDDKPDEIIIGSGLARALGGLVAGDYVQLITGRGAETAFGRTPRQKDYKIGAVFSLGNTDFDSLFIFMPLDQAQLFFRYKGAVQKIELRVDKPDEIDEALYKVQEQAGGRRIRDWREVNASYYNALKIERGMVRIILFLIVAVAALNIITGLIMMVKDKTRDIAILRTMGITKGSVMRIFMLSGTSIGVLGTIAGLILGVGFVQIIAPLEKFLSNSLGIRLFSPDIYLFSEIPAQVQVTETIMVIGWTLFMSLITTLYPAWKASKLDPVEALRYE